MPRFGIRVEAGVGVLPGEGGGQMGVRTLAPLRVAYLSESEQRKRGEYPERGENPRGCFSNFVVAQTASYVTLSSSTTRIAWALD